MWENIQKSMHFQISFQFNETNALPEQLLTVSLYSSFTIKFVFKGYLLLFQTKILQKIQDCILF